MNVAYAALRVLAGLGLMLANGVVLIYMLRKVLGHLHVRLGPMEVGPKGIVQTTADVLKLLTKEDPTPAAVDKVIYFIAPAVVFVPSLMAYAALPFSAKWHITDLNLGLLYTFSILSLIPLGILMAGWASSNKWSLFGGMRAVAQQIACEVPLLLAALPVVLLAGSLNMNDIVKAQAGYWLGFIPAWFWIPMFPALILYLISALIETNQTPFDMSEAESELVAGFATEYASMKFGLLFLSEFSNLFVQSALIVTLFFGGWLIPFVPLELQQKIGISAPVVFMLKTYLVIFVMMWIRGTLPRVRIDHMMSLGWKILLPVSVSWAMITAFVVKLAEVGR
ncbi:MAG: NADH-quinone oxidoreductase subunit NuoH [Coriobacteriales bacterium]|nr:NADH-quinone oxidoreductase subunit NuoH [Coriobacteriales bacterium]